jgi:hypothetical protein
MSIQTLLMIRLVALSNRDLKRLERVAANDLYWYRFANPVASQQELQVFRIADGMSIEADQDIANQNTTTLSRAVLVNFDDQQACLLRATGPLSCWQMDKLTADAQIAAFNISLLRQRFGDILSDCDRNCQRNAIDEAGGQNADDRALCIDQWAA